MPNQENTMPIVPMSLLTARPALNASGLAGAALGAGYLAVLVVVFLPVLLLGSASKLFRLGAA
jgi:hypothetical protein